MYASPLFPSREALRVFIRALPANTLAGTEVLVEHHQRPRRVKSRERKLALIYAAVETFFSVLTRRRLKRGSFHSIVDLQAAINRYIAEHNADPKPFIWTKILAQILTRLNRLSASVH